MNSKQNVRKIKQRQRGITQEDRNFKVDFSDNESLNRETEREKSQKKEKQKERKFEDVRLFKLTF